jgi:uncharacterized protein
MNFPQSYIDYLVHFHSDRDYFECHEILEDFWKEKEVQHRDEIWVAFIQIAVGLYHQRRYNFKGAYRMVKNARRIMKGRRTTLEELGLHAEKLLASLKSLEERIRAEKAYESFYFPIASNELQQVCKKEAANKQLLWWQPSNLSNKFIIDRHKLRDRTEIILQRETNLYKKRKNRQC